MGVNFETIMAVLGHYMSPAEVAAATNSTKNFIDNLEEDPAGYKAQE